MAIVIKYKFLIAALILNLLLILFVYQSVFLLELQGDTWQYAWGHQIYYGSNVFSELSLAGMRTSLGGASLTFGLIQNHFGLSSIVYYSISVFLKFLTVVCFYLLAKKLTGNFFASLAASLVLSVTYAGIEATHWVFNMYAYIGLIFVLLSVLTSIDLPVKFNVKKWFISYLLACAGVWYATMRTSGVIPLILVFALIKVFTIRSKDSFKNLFFWIGGFIVFILIDKFLLGQMESDYSRYYIIDMGIQSFKSQIALSKYDFFLSPAINLGSVILPDVTWAYFDFQKTFSFFGASKTRSVILPSFLMFSAISWIISKALSKTKKKIFGVDANFLLFFQIGLLWTFIVYFVSKLGAVNFPSTENLVMTLFGGYVLCLSLAFIVIKEVPGNLKNLFLISFFSSFLYLLLPGFQNGGPIFGTYHRYMVSTAPSIPLFFAGLMTLAFLFKSNYLRGLTIAIVILMIFSHGFRTKAFFDRKAQVHNRYLQAKIWDGFTRVVPNKPEYAMKNPPVIWFETADNRLDQETLFESLFFGFLFQASIKYGWDPHSGTGMYYQNYPELKEYIKKNPDKLDVLYGVRIQDQSVVDVTEKLKQKIAEDISKTNQSP